MWVPSVADDLCDAFAHAHHLEQRLARQALHGVVPARHRLEELELRDDAFTHGGRRFLVVLEFSDALAQRSEGWIDLAALAALRSEERRVGKECRSRWSPYH